MLYLLLFWEHVVGTYGVLSHLSTYHMYDQPGILALHKQNN